MTTISGGLPPDLPVTPATTGWPAMNMAEARQWAGDEEAGRHWSSVQCWCGVRHEDSPSGFGLVLPPWDAVTLKESRSGEPSRAIRRLVLARDGFYCAGCGVSIMNRAYTVQLRMTSGGPQAREDSPVGWVLVCGGCRDACWKLDPMMDGRGLWLWPNQDPALEPVAYALPGTLAWLWLTDDGGLSGWPPGQSG